MELLKGFSQYLLTQFAGRLVFGVLVLAIAGIFNACHPSNDTSSSSYSSDQVEFSGQ